MKEHLIFSTRSSSQHGALKHWVIGCLVIVVIIVLMLVGGAFFVWKKVAPSTFDTAAKVDPPPTAGRDVLLPERIGSYQRVDYTEKYSSSFNVDTSGSMKAVYEDPAAGKTVTVQAVPSDEMKSAQKQGKMTVVPNAGSGDGDPQMGFSFKIPIGPQKMQLAVWAKENWTYLVHTTGTEVLDFAKEFSPAAGDGPVDQK